MLELLKKMAHKPKLKKRNFINMMENKAYYRKKYLGQRKQMDFKAVNQLSERIISRLQTLDVIKNAERIFAFMSFNNEVDCYLIKPYLDAEKRVLALPKVEGKGQMKFYCVNGYEDLSLSKFGILEPIASCVEIEARKGDVVLVPGLVFSEEGYRIGYGGGYYDRLIKAYPEVTFIGLAYENQIDSSIPFDAHDQQVHRIITEERQVICSKNR